MLFFAKKKTLRNGSKRSCIQQFQGCKNTTFLGVQKYAPENVVFLYMDFCEAVGILEPSLVRNTESKGQKRGDKMTHEQKLLCYLYGVDSIQRRQLVIALPDIPYQSLTLAVRNAIKHGYVEVFRKDESNYLRISPDGIKYIRTTAKDSLDSEKRATMKRRFKGEQGRRLNRVETTSCMCRAAGIKLAKEEGIQLTNILNANTKDYEKFMENYFYNKGLLFLSDELSATIKATNTVGEEYTTGMSRLVGAIINSKGIYYLYCTLDKLMKWIISYEKRRVSVITALLQNSNAATESQDFQTACAIQPKSIIIGKTCAMIPKIITGDKYGKNIKRAGEATITNKLMTLANLEEVYKHNYFVPTDTLGVELLSRTVTLTRDDLNQMIEMWLSEMTDKHTTIEAREYVEAYINDEESKTLVFPIIELEELVFQKAVKEKYHTFTVKQVDKMQETIASVRSVFGREEGNEVADVDEDCITICTGVTLKPEQIPEFVKFLQTMNDIAEESGGTLEYTAEFTPAKMDTFAAMIMDKQGDKIIPRFYRY